MNELRKDPLLDRWVIIAKNRNMRPREFRHEPENVVGDEKTCFFCPGNEHMTPPEISRIEEDGRWIIRCFPNKFPALSVEDMSEEDDFYVKKAAYGRHEIIVELPYHNKDMSYLDVDHISNVWDMYCSRLKEIRKDPQIKYISIFKNWGHRAGASLQHSHSQLIAMPIVPSQIQEEVDALIEYRERKGSCAFCDIWRKEMESERGIYEDEHTVVFAPYASRFPYEMRIMPKRHIDSLAGFKREEKISLAKAFKTALTSLNQILDYPAHNFYLHSSPNEGHLHFYIAIFPRITRWAGFELANGVIINVVSPESAAEYYRTGVP